VLPHLHHEPDGLARLPPVARVLILGASGLIGGILREHLAERHSLTGIDRRPDRRCGVGRGDVGRRRSIAGAFDGVDAVVDLATSPSVDLSWKEVERDMHGRVNVLEEARAHGVARYVFASSNHVTGMYELDPPYSAIVAGEYEGLDPGTLPRIATDWPIRPDSPYGIGKAFAEATARHYADEHGISCVCLRIGTVRADDRPAQPRHYATLLSHRDLTRLVACAIEAPPSIGFGVYYGVSANTWRFWDLANAQAELGFEPADDAEAFRQA
jgi:nucleoside-diphosphate-sugar epimerase